MKTPLCPALRDAAKRDKTVLFIRNTIIYLEFPPPLGGNKKRGEKT